VKNTIHDILKKNFPFITSDDVIRGIVENGSVQVIDEGDYLIDIGNAIKSIPLIISGSVKVMREDSNGQELLLYYLKAGETCAMSLTCCMEGRKSEIRAVATDTVQMIEVPVQFMDLWMAHRDWRAFVMATYAKRFDELLETIDSIAFHKMDERLLSYLRIRSANSGTNILDVSHHEIAEDLNTSREVVSRLLKQMENQGLLTLGRSRITLST
jgi:CRP/FNR family transcriptional regulator, anaerobic regulatory protein